MAKLTLNNAANGGPSGIATINANNDLIETAVENTLSRNGTSPNQMGADFDMNNNDILNAGVVNATTAFIGGIDVASIVTRAEVAARAAEEAASSVVGGALGRPFETKSLAQAYNPTVSPNFIDTAYYDTSFQKGSGARWTKVAVEPTHSGKLQIASGTWYELAETTLRPEMFGQIGVNAAGDTAAWVALASTANSRTKARVVADGIYDIAGSTVIFDGSLTKLNFRLLNAEFYQQTTFSKTIRAENIDDVRVHGGYFEGLGGTSGEYDGASSSYNGVAAIHFLNCDKVFVSAASEYNHAGGGFVVIGGRVRRFENNTCEGIGYPYIDPLATGGIVTVPNQGNGSDFGIMLQPSVNGIDWKYEDTVVNNRIFDHAFGAMSVQTKSAVYHGNHIGPCPGQHGVYGIELDGVSLVGNHIHDCRQQGFKNQFENYAGTFGPAFVPNQVYAVGDYATNSSNLWRKVTAGAQAVFANDGTWELAPISIRKSAVFTSNIFERCQQGISYISTSLSDGRAIWAEGVIITGNTFRDNGPNDIRLDRCLDADILGNQFNGATQQAIYLVDFRGRVADNTFRNSKWTAVYAALSGDIYYERNLHINSGLSGTDQEKLTPSLLIFSRNMTTTIPDMPLLRYINFRGNEIRFTGTEGTGLYMFSGYDTDCVWRVTDTRCNPGTTKKGRVDGGTAKIGEYWRNDFASMNDTTQNDTTFDFTNETSLLTLDPTTATTANVANAFATYVKLQAGKRNGNFT